MTLKEARKKAGLSQNQLADAAGVCRSTIPKYESGGRAVGNLAARNYIAICDVLGVDPRDLLEDEPRDNRGGNMM